MTNLDFYRLISFLFYASLDKLPRKSDYWSAPFDSEIVMKNTTRHQIYELLRSLSFGDNILPAQLSDKIQLLIELFHDRCYSLVQHEKNISIDEQIVGYKGTSAPKH